MTSKLGRSKNDPKSSEVIYGGSLRTYIFLVMCQSTKTIDMAFETSVRWLLDSGTLKPGTRAFKWFISFISVLLKPHD